MMTLLFDGGVPKLPVRGTTRDIQLSRTASSPLQECEGLVGYCWYNVSVDGGSRIRAFCDASARRGRNDSGWLKVNQGSCRTSEISMCGCEVALIKGRPFDSSTWALDTCWSG